VSSIPTHERILYKGSEEERAMEEKTKEVQTEQSQEQVLSTPNEETKQPLKTKDEEYTEKIQRLQAEFENARKRAEKERTTIIQNANLQLITQLLPVLDNFELSLKNTSDKGVHLIYGELQAILEKQGLKTIEAKGQFNPQLHEVVLKVPGEKEGLIVEEIQKGYTLNNKLLRASKIKISTGPTQHE
jgi:molecular chaperone GrpE